VGAISSNHDRACELFYQIKGGKVDYGDAHAKQYGHNRFGSTYQGLYSQWGKGQPVHIIGHSMGGQTCRVLVELLSQNNFGMGTDETWVKSVTTISSPHNGTTLATMVNNISGGFAEEIVAGFLGLAGSDWKFYNFDMDHWNLSPQPGETLRDFLKRMDSTIGKTKDISMHDLIPKGAQELNQQVRTFADVYYFSYATEETYVLNPSTGFEWAEPAMNPMFWAYASYMGHYQGNEVSPHNLWWKNDGVVNTLSMKGPLNAVIIEKQGNPRPGVWNYMGVVESKDHGKVIGHYQDPLISGRWLKKFFLDMATMLCQLP
jgi:triacylglycerol lipase